METLQAALTLLTEVTAIAGITGIALHATWSSHRRWMAELCPPIAPYTPDTQPATEPEALPDQTEEIVPTLEPMESPQQPVAFPQPVAEPQPVIEDAWEAPITSSPARYWVRPVEATKPVLMLCQALEEPKPTKKSRKTPASPKAPAKPRTSRKRKVA